MCTVVRPHLTVLVRWSWIAGVLLACPGLVWAQVIERAPRTVPGLFGGRPPSPDPERTHQELALDASVLGGYDDNFTPGGGEPSQLLLTGRSTASTYADAALRYWRGRAARSIEIEGRGYTTWYDVQSHGSSLGAGLRMVGSSTLGRHDRIEVADALGYDPLLTLGGFGVLRQDLGIDPVPGTSALQGLTNIRTLNNSLTTSLRHQWGQRSNTSIGYSFGLQNYLDPGGLDTQTQTANVMHEQQISRRVSLRGTYVRSNSNYTSASGDVRPNDNDSVDGGVSYDKPLSRTRHLTFSVTAGAIHVATVSTATEKPISYWMPSGSGTARIDIGRTWGLSANYRRGVTVLESVSFESFSTDSAMVRTGGQLGRHVDLAVSGAFSNGRSGESTSSGTYQTFVATTQARVLVGRCCATVLHYSRYDYRLHNVEVAAGFPTQFDRNAIRVGFQVYLPLYGSQTSGAGRRPVPGTE
jgi:hypothetical protein